MSLYISMSNVSQFIHATSYLEAEAVVAGVAAAEAGAEPELGVEDGTGAAAASVVATAGACIDSVLQKSGGRYGSSKEPLANAGDWMAVMCASFLQQIVLRSRVVWRSTSA